MKFTLRELAEISGGEIAGDASITITGAASIPEANANEITFFGDPRYLVAFRSSGAGAAFVPEDFTEQIVPAQIRVANPSKAFEQVAIRFAPSPIEFPVEIHPTAVIAEDASLGENISIGPHVVIEPGASIGDGTHIGAGCYIGHETTIGAGCTIYPNVTIRERIKIGDRVILHGGIVIGTDGFGFEEVAGTRKKVPQIGIVQIDNDVEIGANTTIDRARFGRTWIQEGVKIDNLVQIAHNVIVGRHTVICAQCGIAGSVRIGARVILAGQVGVAGHLEIDDDTRVGAQCGVTKSLRGGRAWWGYPAVPINEAKEQMVWVRRLGKLLARVKALEEKLRSG